MSICQVQGSNNIHCGIVGVEEQGKGRWVGGSGKPSFLPPPKNKNLGVEPLSKVSKKALKSNEIRVWKKNNSARNTELSTYC